METQVKLNALANEIEEIGLDGSALRASAKGEPSYDAALPAISDLAEALRSGVARDRPRAADLATQLEEILGDLQSQERSAPAEEQEGNDSLARATFNELKAEYIQLFQSCSVAPAYQSQVAWHVQKLTAHRADYERIGNRVQIPWYFIGIVHGLEASFRFGGHLHNGDPLSARTVNVPKGRPLVWNPPNDWDSSAVDALEFEGFANRTDWSLPRMLYRWEAYNGFGTRAHGIHTPYLWSFSNHYTRGKYKADGKWDPNLVSKQCGAAVMLRALLDTGHIGAPIVA